MTLRAKETLVGVFILTGLAALGWLTLFVGNWAAITGGAGYRVTAKFENIGGLTSDTSWCNDWSSFFDLKRS